MSRSYDNRGRITSIDAGGMLQRRMSWSPEGTITGIADGIKPLASQSFSYDLADRLIYASGVYGIISYSYDGNGNRLSKTDATGTQSYAYQTGTNRLIQTITPWAHYTYDGAGNQTRAGWLNYSYGADNRMSQSASGYKVYGSYVYNGQGERAIRHGLYGGGTTYYVYDEQGHLLGEYDVNGISINEYAYGPTGREARLAYWGGIHTYYNDHLGTPQVITNWSQNILWEGDYKPFGEVAAVRRNPNGNAWSFWNNLRFPGQIWDYSSQTVYNYFRNLDPKTGRYTQHDLIGLNGGMNPYGYVGGNPVTGIDPFGLEVWGINSGGSFTVFGTKFAASTALLFDSRGKFSIVTTQEAGAGKGKSAGLFFNGVWGGSDTLTCNYSGTGTSVSGSLGFVSGAVSLPDYGNDGGAKLFYELGWGRSRGGGEIGVTRTFGQEVFSSNILGNTGRWWGNHIYGWTH